MKHIQYSKKDFAWVRWTQADIAKAADECVAAKRKAYAAVKKIPKAERTFENTVYAIEASNHAIVDAFKISLLMYVSPKEAVRELDKGLKLMPNDGIAKELRDEFAAKLTPPASFAPAP